MANSQIFPGQQLVQVPATAFVSCFADSQVPTDLMEFQAVIHSIRTGAFAEQVHRVRMALAEGLDARAELQRLPCFTPSGYFEDGDTISHLEQYTGYLMLTLPLGEEGHNRQRIEDAVRSLPCTVASFLSICESQLQVVFWVSTSLGEHARQWIEASNVLLRRTGVLPEQRPSSVTRKYAFSYDPQAYFNPEATSFEFHSEAAKGLNASASTGNVIQSMADEQDDKVEVDAGRSMEPLTDLLPSAPVAAHTAKAVGKDEAATTAILQTEDVYCFPAAYPLIPEAVYNGLPDLLRAATDVVAAGRERDVILVGTLVTLSACLDIKGQYDGNTYWPNLYGLVLAPPASGKGRFAKTRALAESLHQHRRTEYNELLAHYNRASRRQKALENAGMEASDEPVPVKPKPQALLVPGNTSTAMLYELLTHGKSCLIHESEADTVSNMLRSGWGDFSPIMRNSFHHEAISVSRKSDAELTEITCPRLSVALAGTPSQLSALISSAEDGLFSRFIFYAFEEPLKWRAMSSAGSGSTNLAEHFSALSQRVETMARHLSSSETWFDLTPAQYEQLNEHFNRHLQRVTLTTGEEAGSLVFRMGLILFRIAMILTGLRKAEAGSLEQRVACAEADFDVALQLAEVFLQHSLTVFEMLPRRSAGVGKGRAGKALQRLLACLPAEPFTRKQAVEEYAQGLMMSKRTIDGHLSTLVANGLLTQPITGWYQKV